MELGHDVCCTRASSYGKALPLSAVQPFAESADLIVVGSNHGVEHGILELIDNARVVALDGSDHARLLVPDNIRFKCVFKRELCVEEHVAESDFIYPLPFAAEKRYFIPRMQKDILVSFVATMDTNPLRASLHRRLLNRRNPGIFSGNTGERAYSSYKPMTNPLETPEYRKILARSQISVNAPGAGYDCARYWEILAVGAMLLTYEPGIVIPDPFTDGVNCVTFASLNEFDEKLDFYMAHPERVETIAGAGHEHLMAFHTTAKRAAYFLEKAIPAASREGFCEAIFQGDRPRTALTRLRRNLRFTRAKNALMPRGI